MFHFAGLPAYDYEFIVCSELFVLSGFPIRISPDQSPLAAPRGFSQPATSFVDAYRLGIHHVLFSTSIPYFDWQMELAAQAPGFAGANFRSASTSSMLRNSRLSFADDLENKVLRITQRDCIRF